ncbi:MAG: serine--tRNA ligase [Chitinispirillia bacterium]|nr:serine--tRNA ligase [Chitinispirillia bacterium]MCL2242709.1 serine--tRNA ligase [Chitinispirillia bacterium]
MIDIQRIRDNPGEIAAAAARKKCQVDINAVVELDSRRRDIIKEAERLKGARNSASQEIARLKKAGQDAEALVQEMKRVGETIKGLDEELAGLERKRDELMSHIPNVPHESVPRGDGAQDNVVVAEWGEEPAFDFKPKDHIELGTALDIMDFPRGAKIAGAGFPVLKGKGALMERALINFFLDTHTRKNGYTEIFPPFLTNRESLYGVGQLPKFGDQMYYMGEDELYCIPTAEVPVTNLHRDEIFDPAKLPVNYCAYSACFRREAGSYGKDTKGYLRVHQFNKVELVKFVDPETSYAEHEKLRMDAESILRALNLKYRTLLLCDGDMSFSAAKCYDLEAWAAAEGKYLEVSSCSNFEDFQARRANIRVRGKGGGDNKPRYVHTLNGSGLATARIIVAILENYQTAAGTVAVPEVLRPYMGGMAEITV